MPYLSTRQACKILAVSRWKITQLINDGELEAIKGGAPNSHLKIQEDSIEKYIERNRVKATP